MVENKRQWSAWLYLLPAILLLLVFTIWPIVNTVRMALLEDYSGLKAAAGQSFSLNFNNFIEVIQYGNFITCFFCANYGFYLKYNIVGKKS